MVTLVLAARDGQVATIAGYAFGLSVVSLVVTVAGGGTTLAFTIGDDRTRRAVRRLRLRVVAPLALVAVVAAALLASREGGLSWTAVAAGGVSATCSNLSELEASYLRGVMRTPYLTLVDVTSRFVGLALVVAGSDFAVALATAAVARYAVLSSAARADVSRTASAGETRTLAEVYRRGFPPALFVVSMSYVVIDRLPFLIAPALFPGVLAGSFATLLTAQQSLSAVMVTGLQVVLAVRSRQTGSTSWLQHFETLTGIAAVLAGIVLAAAARPVLELTGLDTGLRDVWVALSIGLPVAVLARLLAYRRLAQHRSATVAIALGAAAVTSLIVFVSTLAWATDPLQIAVLYPATELLACLLLVAVARRRPEEQARRG